MVFRSDADKLGMSHPAIKLEHIKKSYLGNDVLKDVTLTLEAGQFCALIGKNGVGKSTLIRLVVRQENPSSGEAYVLGRDIKVDSASFNEDVAYVSESIDYALPTSLGVFFKHYGRTFSRWNQERFTSILAQMGISLEQNFRSLSRGQRMHVAFAAAAASEPKVLILDEITSVLDANARSFFMSYLGEFTRQGGTVLLATNIISEVQHYADRLVLLQDGAIKLNVAMKELPSAYVKVRKPKETDHPFFQDPECFEVGLNSDGSLSFVAPLAKAAQYKIPEALKDHRGITAEEVFIYFTRSRSL